MSDDELVTTTPRLMKQYRDVSMFFGFLMGLGTGYALAGVLG